LEIGGILGKPKNIVVQMVALKASLRCFEIDDESFGYG
jgi:hypothetical protein